jgi:hypothetical protein
MPVHRLRVLLSHRRLDARLAEGEWPTSDAELELRAAQLCAPRTRRRLAIGLERALTDDGRPSWSAAAPIDRRAVDDARPYLAQLAAMLRSPEPVAPRGVARALRLLTEVPSPLYAPAEPADLRREAGLALFWLDPAPREPLPAAATTAA